MSFIVVNDYSHLHFGRMYVSRLCFSYSHVDIGGQLLFDLVIDTDEWMLKEQILLLLCICVCVHMFS